MVGGTQNYIKMPKGIKSKVGCGNDNLKMTICTKRTGSGLEMTVLGSAPAGN